MTRPNPMNTAPVFPTQQPESQIATALFRDDTGRSELQVAINNETGYLTATLSTPNLEASGHSQAALVPSSSHTTVLATTVALSGYDPLTDRFGELEVSIGATWTRDRCNPAATEVAGTALIADLQTQTITSLRAVRHHPYNQLSPVQPIIATEPLDRIKPDPSRELAAV